MVLCAGVCAGGAEGARCIKVREVKLKVAISRFAYSVAGWTQSVFVVCLDISPSV